MDYGDSCSLDITGCWLVTVMIFPLGTGQWSDCNGYYGYFYLLVITFLFRYPLVVLTFIVFMPGHVGRYKDPCGGQGHTHTHTLAKLLLVAPFIK